MLVKLLLLGRGGHQRLKQRCEGVVVGSSPQVVQPAVKVVAMTTPSHVGLWHGIGLKEATLFADPVGDISPTCLISPPLVCLGQGINDSLRPTALVRQSVNGLLHAMSE